MRISTQFKITLIVFTVALALIGSSIVATTEKINGARTQESLANSIVQASSELTYLTNDYVLFQGNQQLSQWQIRYTSFSQDVANLNVDTPEQKALVLNIQTNQKQIKTVFDSTVSSLGTSQNQTSDETLSALQVSWSRISIKSQSLISDSSQLAELLRTQVDQLNTVNLILILAIIVTFSAFLTVVYVQTFRRTLKSVSDLRSGATIIGSGNLDYKIEDNKKDEIGELSSAFNKMTSNLRTANQKLKDAERLAAIGATAGMVGHDIRNPLQAITSDLYLAKTELATTPETEEKKNALESLDEIGKNIDYINKIVQDLQDYARPLSPQSEEADLQLLIEKVLAKNNIPDNIKVSIKVQNEIKKIRSDSYFINRIMYNLITNSVQAMPNGGKLTISALREADNLTISVTDTGVGIPKNIQNKMFTPMFTTKSKGQGFGLPVVKRMAEALGGAVTFESKEGEGTTFIVRFPQK